MVDAVSYDMRVYALADALGMALEGGRSPGRLNGGRQKKWKIGGMEILFEQRVVSSAMLQESVMTICRVKGNLAVLAVVDPQANVQVHLLNLARMGKVENWLENQRLSAPSDAVALLGHAVVRSYVKTKKGWAPA